MSGLGRRTRRPVVGPRVIAISLLSVCAAVLAGCVRRAEEPAAERPALVVLVTVDTLRADHLPFYGYPQPTAPFLTELAGRSVVFDNAFTAASHTAPAHASMLTSRYPYEHLLLRNGQAIMSDTLTLAELLAQHGYDTGAFASVTFLEPLARRFAHADAVWRPGAETVDAAIGWLAHRPRDTRVFLWVHLFDVHEWLIRTGEPYRPFRAVLAREASLSGAQLRELLVRTQRLDPAVVEREHVELPEAIGSYDARIRYVDAQLRRLFAAGEDWRGPRAALWIVTGDHGEGLGAHQYLRHGRYLYQEQLHVPLMVFRSAAVSTPRRVEVAVHHVDLLPTVAEIVGVTPAPAAAWRGRSLLPLLRDPTAPWAPRFLFSQRRPADLGREQSWLPGDVVALYDLDHKYIYRTHAAHELYDLRADPHEEHNLIDAPSAVRDQLRAAIQPYAAAVAHQEDHAPGPTIQPEHLEQLRALGYGDGTRE